MKELKDLTVGLAITGSFCTFDKIKKATKELKEAGMRIRPIFSNQTATCNCRFGCADEFVKEIEDIAGQKGIYSICEAEPIGPKGYLDLELLFSKVTVWELEKVSRERCHFLKTPVCETRDNRQIPRLHILRLRQPCGFLPPLHKNKEARNQYQPCREDHEQSQRKEANLPEFYCHIPNNGA